LAGIARKRRQGGSLGSRARKGLWLLWSVPPYSPGRAVLLLWLLLVCRVWRREC
jgi:hypothetical protein